MCKAIINRVDLGKRVTGYELLNESNGEIVGLTAVQIKTMIDSGEIVLGVKMNGKEVELDNVFCKNILVKSGINTYRPLVDNGTMMVNMVYTVIAYDEGKQLYEIINSKFARAWVTVDKLRVFDEVACVNGVNITADKINLCEGVKVINEKKEETKELKK